MFSQTTRLELIIVVTAMLLLWVCSRPPRSGNAQIYLDREQPAPQAQPPALQSSSGDRPSPPASEAATKESSAAATQGAPATPQPPRIKRIGVVDTRSCDKLSYKGILYGEIAIREVWNGQKLVPHKVCIVRESNGVVSTWDFDEHDDDVTVSEIELPPDAAP
jgi:hypothetical protein